MGALELALCFRFAETRREPRSDTQGLVIWTSEGLSERWGLGRVLGDLYIPRKY